MMKSAMIVAALLAASPAIAQDSLEAGLSGALRGCEEWVLNPASWAEGTAPFLSTVGLGDRMGLVQSVGEPSLPPEGLRAGNHYWRINSTENAGYVLVVSDRLPMCHITGGGGSDLQPVVEAVLGDKAFQDRWMQEKEETKGDIVSTFYRNREVPAFSLVVSRANTEGGRQDRVQLIATAQMELDG